MRHLFKASTGAFPTAGQHAAAFIPGVAPGVKGSHYFVNSWALREDAPGQGMSVILNPAASPWTLTFDIGEGAQAWRIRRVGSVLVAAYEVGGTSVFGASVGVTGVVDTTTVIVSSLSLIPKPMPGSGPSSNIAVWGNPGSYGSGKWFKNFTYPTLAPIGTAEEIEFFLHGTSAGSSGGYSQYDVSLTYTPDIGPFNPNLVWNDSILMYDRGTTLADFELEWSSDGGANVHATGNYFTRLQSVAYENFSIHYRYRYVGGSWSAWQEVQWVDPRI